MVVHVCIQVQAHVLIYSPVCKCLDMHGSTLYVGCPGKKGHHYISIAIIFINYMHVHVHVHVLHKFCNKGKKAILYQYKTIY